MKSDSSFWGNVMEGEWTTRKRANGKMGNRIVKRPIIFPLARTYARIYRSFYFFAVTSVTQLFLKCWLKVNYDVF